MTVSGSCQCGRVHYQLTEPPLLTYVCHCKDCQKRTGSAFAMGSVYPATAISVSGKLSGWDRVSDRGVLLTRYSCSNCGNIIYGVSADAKEVIKLQPGTLDNTREVRADVHVWTRSAQPWVVIPADTPQYETQPENPMALLEAVK